MEGRRAMRVTRPILPHDDGSMRTHWDHSSSSCCLTLSCPAGRTWAFLYLEPWWTNRSWRAQAGGLWERKKKRQTRTWLSMRTSIAWEHSIQMRHGMKGNEYNVGGRRVQANQEREWRETKRMKMDDEGLQRKQRKSGSEDTIKHAQGDKWSRETVETERRRGEVRGRRNSRVVSLRLFNRD